jgi:beta-lactamase superfamily II metal-dependent hydrolase
VLHVPIEEGAMAAEGLSIEMLQADHGDALWIEWDGPARRHRVVVDAGPKSTFDTVRERFERLDLTDRVVDLFVVTHIDLDHIGGAIELLNTPSLGVQYRDVWFNDLRHLSGEPVTRGALQGEELAALIEGERLTWNGRFDGQAVVVPESGPLPRVELDGGVQLVLLSPTREKLLALQSTWVDTIEEAKRAAEERALDQMVDGDEADEAQRGGKRFGRDKSTANGSSIAFILEAGDARWLLAGDAHADVLTDGLRRYAEEIGEQRVRLDGFKLPHHGSMSNVTADLLDAIECSQYLVSTNGKYFKHPDVACLDLVVEHSATPTLLFNNLAESTKRWAAPSDRYVARFPEADGCGLVVGRGAASVPHTTAPAVDAAAGPIASEEPPTGSAADASVASEAPARTVTEVAVEVIHGSLELADDPVLVGHYTATPLSGTEAFIDRRYLNRLSNRFTTNQYPGEIGTSLFVRPPRHRHPAAGVIVVGLGEYGELTPLRLVETVRAALVRRAFDEAESANPDVRLDLGIASVLLGATGDQGLTVAATVRAVVLGVVEANRTLRTSMGTDRVQYRSLEIWERYESSAELAYRAVLSLDDGLTAGVTAGDGDTVVPARSLRAAGGAQDNSPVIDSVDPSWWRLRISDATAGGAAGDADSGYLELDFAVSGRLARTGTVRHRVERRRLQRLLRTVVGQPAPGAGVHTTLFELLFPNQLKWDLMGAQEIQLELDDTTADIPWEMLAARNPADRTRGQLALRAPLIRQLRLAELPQTRRATRPTALVIGNPPSGGLPDLKGAETEARTVRKLLADAGYAVNSLCYSRDQPVVDAVTEIETALFADDYRIVHIAGHGMFDPDDPTRTGVVIGSDEFLTAQVFRQLNVLPDVVFLNCCHLGGVANGIEGDPTEFTRQHLNRLGASLARQLIDSGVRAVVAAGWAVDDDAAIAFAHELYRAMLGGSAFGDAVHRGRRAADVTAQRRPPKADGTPRTPSSTWGAYQCYGDAGYRLPVDPSRDKTQRVFPTPLTIKEAIRRIERIVSQIEFIGVGSNAVGAPAGGDDERGRAERELVVIYEAAVAAHWFDDSSTGQRLCEQFAEAWAALGDHERAVDLYRKALGSGQGAVRLRSIEQLSNHEDRLANRLIRNEEATDEDRARAKELLALAFERIELLEKIGGSGERSALRAGHFKRAAAASTGAARSDALRRAAEAYRSAYEQAKSSRNSSYGLFNFIQLEEIRRLSESDTSERPEPYADLDAVLASSRSGSIATYWDAVARADGELTKALVERSIVERRPDLKVCYLDAFSTRSTANQRSSTLDHLRDLADLHPDADEAGALRSLYAELLLDD